MCSMTQLNGLSSVIFLKVLEASFKAFTMVLYNFFQINDDGFLGKLGYYKFAFLGLDQL